MKISKLMKYCLAYNTRIEILTLSLHYLFHSLLALPLGLAQQHLLFILCSDLFF
jgi:hypothetical protein